MTMNIFFLMVAINYSGQLKPGFPKFEYGFFFFKNLEHVDLCNNDTFYINLLLILVSVLICLDDVRDQFVF